MPYVYRYLDLFDKKYKYIGIVKSDGMERLQRRIKQHRKDDWFKKADYYVDYIQVDSQCDAEALEGHYIAKYATFDYYNKAKSKWGLSSVYSSLNPCWHEYGIESAHAIYQEQAEKLSKKVNELVKKKQEAEVGLKKLSPYTIIDYGPIAHVSFYAIREELFEKIKLYDDYSINCETETTRDKWAYRANRLRSAVSILENSILEHVRFLYSKEYKEVSTAKGENA